MLKLMFLFASMFRLLSLTTGEDDPKPEKVKASDLLERYGGDAVKMAERLADLSNDNAEYRAKRSGYESRIQQLESKQTPDGALILSGDDIALWEAYKGIGQPDEVKTRLTDAEAAIAERDNLKKSMTIRQVAEVAGYKASVLERLGADLTYEVKDVQETVQGKLTTVKRAFVVKDGKEMPLADHAKTEWADFLPALGATEQAPPLYGTPPRDRQRGTPPGPETPAEPLTHIRL